MKVCYTALFGDHDDLKEPAIITQGWRYVCFTDQPVTSKVWEMIPTNVIDTPRRTARWFKIMGWVDWQYSMWVDASFTITCDLNEWWAKRFVSPFSAARHPLRTSIYAEARACIANGRDPEKKVEKQWLRYQSLGFPDHQGIITSGILLRENTPECIQLHEAWWRELYEQSDRDQLAFAFVSLGSKLVTTYQWDYGSRTQKDFLYTKHKGQ